MAGLVLRMLPGYIMPDAHTDDNANTDCNADGCANVRPEAHAYAQAPNADADSDTIMRVPVVVRAMSLDAIGVFNYYPIEWKSGFPCCSYLDRCTACPYRKDINSHYVDTTDGWCRYE